MIPHFAEGIRPPFSLVAPKKTGRGRSKRKTLLSKVAPNGSTLGMRCLDKILLEMICGFSVGRGKHRILDFYPLPRELEQRFLRCLRI